MINYKDCENLDGFGNYLKEIIEDLNNRKIYYTVPDFKYYIKKTGLYKFDQDLNSNFTEYAFHEDEYKNIEYFFNKFKEDFKIKLKQPTSRNATTYSLKHLIENIIKKDEVNKYAYCSQGLLILALTELGFEFYTVFSTKPTGNAHSNYSAKALTKILNYINDRG